YGVALLAAVGDGAYKNIQQACDATVRVVTETPVQRSQKRKYDRRFPVYQRLYHALKEDFKRIAAAEG
ncbi:MAG TPA: xylulokinase, partial [Planctomycetaceae bacterium]|nr:xylulokinase [Planctomycetaceae bacterium]